jgi:hypothetical protein
METRTLRIAVTGHRILGDLERIGRGVERAIDLILRSYPHRRIVVLSQLAEGADRLLAEAVLRRRGAALSVLLPMPREAYVEDFESPASRIHFEALMDRASRVRELKGFASRVRSYSEAGEAMVRRCDVLLALWDGKEPQGAGGTGEVVQRARAAGKPVVVVLAGNRRPGTTSPTTLGKRQGTVRAEGLPHQR